MIFLRQLLDDQNQQVKSTGTFDGKTDKQIENYCGVTSGLQD